VGPARRLLDLGTIEPARMLALVADTTLEFLDAALRPAAAARAASREGAE
jgi:hypothetical protein